MRYYHKFKNENKLLLSVRGLSELLIKIRVSALLIDSRPYIAFNNEEIKNILRLDTYYMKNYSKKNFKAIR